MSQNYFVELLELSANIVLMNEDKASNDKDRKKLAKKHLPTALEQFKEKSQKYIDSILIENEDYNAAYENVSQLIARLKADSDPSWLPALDYLTENLLPAVRKEAGRGPKVRKALKALPWALGGVAVVAYFSIRLYSAVPIQNPIETRFGIEERAAALEKVIRYDDLMDTKVRKGGWLKGLMLWPIEPSEQEIKGASDFAGLMYEAQDFSVDRFKCPIIPRGYGNKPSPEELKFLESAAEYVNGPNVVWKKPAIITAIDAARSVQKC